ncbi:MAG: phosphate ABC transporter ATP-binding protein [Candidatus Thermoplasmatota archaeon]|nr:phosphate ABC transporter ATP-binding protein [Candidatus Thermoplasmatota archaeon]
MNVFRVSGAKKRLGENRVLRGIDLDVRKGEVLSLVGPSGSGKSTFLRTLNRLIELDSGSILFKGASIIDMDPVGLRRNVVLVTQEAVMLPGTVKENILYGPELAGMKDGCDAGKCLIEAGLSADFSAKDASKLSGGEKKRVSLARALALRPEVLLLDEPTVGVDPKRVKRMERTILKAARSRGLTVVWVTHDIPQAMRVSDRIANLKKGKVVEVKNAGEFEWEGAY